MQATALVQQRPDYLHVIIVTLPQLLVLGLPGHVHHGEHRVEHVEPLNAEAHCGDGVVQASLGLERLHNAGLPAVGQAHHQHAGLGLHVGGTAWWLGRGEQGGHVRVVYWWGRLTAAVSRLALGCVLHLCYRLDAVACLLP